MPVGGFLFWRNGGGVPSPPHGSHSRSPRRDVAGPTLRGLRGTVQDATLLVMVHNLPRGQVLPWRAQGSSIALLAKGLPRGTHPRALRGRVQSFSKASRRRLIQTIGQCDLSGAAFVTLTYGALYPDDMAAKAHLRAFFKRLRRIYPGCRFVWRIELQRRGAPHFHLLVWGVPWQRFGCRWRIRREWFLQVQTGDAVYDRHLLAHSCEVVGITHHGVYAYVGKYASKMAAVGVPDGRQWGCLGKPKADYEDFDAPLLDVAAWCRGQGRQRMFKVVIGVNARDAIRAIAEEGAKHVYEDDDSGRGGGGRRGYGLEKREVVGAGSNRRYWLWPRCVSLGGSDGGGGAAGTPDFGMEAGRGPLLEGFVCEPCLDGASYFQQSLWDGVCPSTGGHQGEHSWRASLDRENHASL